MYHPPISKKLSKKERKQFIKERKTRLKKLKKLYRKYDNGFIRPETLYMYEHLN